MNTILRKSILGIAGLAFAGGITAGPAIAAQAAPATVKPAAAVAVQANKPSMDKLIPHGVQGAQSSITLNADQTTNAKAIIAATKKAGLDERAAVIAVATSLQESKLQNLGSLGAANDHDSLGLFQQRPSSGWGTPQQILDPQYSTTAFLNGLKQISGWHDMPLSAAAQAVQVSAYPDAYAQWETQAAGIVADNWNN
jgi:hypothetical protein